MSPVHPGDMRVGQSQRSGPSSLLASPFMLSGSPDWFSHMQNKACTHHQWEGMQAVALLRLISEEGCFGACFLARRSLSALCFLFVYTSPAVVFLVATFWSRHLGVLSPKLPTISIYSPSPSTMTKDKAFTV